MGSLGHRSRRLAAEDGFALMEVLAAAVLLLVISMASLSVFDVTAKITGSSKARSIAANLAQQDQERMRAMKAVNLSNYHWSHPVSVPGGGTYTVDSRADWVRDAGGLESCTVSNSQADYLRVTSTVSQANLSDPVTMSSLVAPGVVAFDANSGTLTVKVTDRDGDPVPGADVAIGGPTSLSDTTNSLGCAVFSHIPIGTYTATTHKYGYVDNNGNDPGAVTGTPIVTQGKVSMVPARLDAAAAVTTTFETYVNTYAASSNGGAGGVWIPSKAETVTADPLTSSDPSDVTTPGGWQASIVAAGLYPFTEGYSIYTGSCANADPSKSISNYYASNPGTVMTDPAGTYNLKVRQAPLPVKVVDAVGNPKAGAHVVATGLATGGCTADKFDDLVSDAKGLVSHPGGFDPGVPFGKYAVCADIPVIPAGTYLKTTINVDATTFTVSTPTSLKPLIVSTTPCT
jgi:Tfp pilus assembly protein PilV